MTFDVAIIGGGAAGLSAARVLSGAGRKVCIIEARPRFGGRIFTLHPSDLPLPIELGAEFVHGATPTTFRIIDAAALPACELPDNHWWSTGTRWESVDPFWGKVESVVRRIPSRGRDISIAAFLAKQKGIPPRLRELSLGFVEGYHAAPADRISAHALRNGDREVDEGANRQFRVITGQDSLVDWLRSGLDPSRVVQRLGLVARLVEWSRGRAIIHCAPAGAQQPGVEKVRAAAAIVTLPIGVWRAAGNQEGAVTFDPPLREKEEALSLIEPGHVVKVAFRFREPFWQDASFLEARRSGRGSPAPLHFVHSADPFMPTWWTTAPVRSPVLVGWAGGPAADALRAEGPDAIAGRGLDSLSRVFGIARRTLTGMLAGIFTHDWQSDPFSRCAYSYAAVGGADAHRDLARPLRQTLFFAGEATSGDETGTVAGAIASGTRAAHELLRANARSRKYLRNMR